MQRGGRSRGEMAGRICVVSNKLQTDKQMAIMRPRGVTPDGKAVDIDKEKIIYLGKG